jgi:hypothetical protein
MTPDEINKAWELVRRYGPSNSWTAANGTLAAALGRALEQIERLQYRIAIMEERRTPYERD